MVPCLCCDFKLVAAKGVLLDQDSSLVGMSSTTATSAIEYTETIHGNS